MTTPTQGEHAQPEALRLADALENLEATASSSDCAMLTEYSAGQADMAAAELRRLHAQVVALTASPVASKVCAGERCLASNANGLSHSRECLIEAGKSQGWTPTDEELANAGPSASPVAQADTTQEALEKLGWQRTVCGACGSDLCRAAPWPNWAAKTEHIPAVVLENGAESNMAGGAQTFAHGAIMGAAYDFRDAHLSGSMKKTLAAHAALESAVLKALRASHGQAPAGAALGVTERMLDAAQGRHTTALAAGLTSRKAMLRALEAALAEAPTAQTAPAARHLLAQKDPVTGSIVGYFSDEPPPFGTQAAPAPEDRYERALAELVCKITGADSGNLLDDAKEASKALDERARGAGAVAEPARIELANRIKKCAEHWAYMERIDHGDQAKVEQGRHAELVDLLATAPTPTAQADSVQDLQSVHDAVTIELLHERVAYLEGKLKEADSGVQEDAARYRLIRRGTYWSVINGIGDNLRGEELDKRIDAALAAKGGDA